MGLGGDCIDSIDANGSSSICSASTLDRVAKTGGIDLMVREDRGAERICRRGTDLFEFTQ